MGQSEFEIRASAEMDPPSFVVVAHPQTGAQLLLQNPKLQVVPPKVNAITCNDCESFADVVTAENVIGPNRLIELTDDGNFHYSSDLEGRGTRTVAFALAPCTTSFILCLDGEHRFAQKSLVKFLAQHPECLSPQCDATSAAAVIENMAHLEIKGTTNFKSVHTNGAVSISAEAQKTTVGITIPEFWTARSPLYHGHSLHETTLRLRITEPAVDEENRLKGELTFAFELWTPDAQDVRDAAMADAQERMGGLLPEFTVIRGAIR